jgi:hypothetical protein
MTSFFFLQLNIDVVNYDLMGVTMFYFFRQNNSGGSFDYDYEDGIGRFVIIEALNSMVANKIAESIGLYFNGVENDQDCPCCGDRWYEVDDSDGTETPKFYGEHIDTGIVTKDLWDYKNNVVVHYLSGERKWYKTPADDYY